MSSSLGKYFALLLLYAAGPLPLIPSSVFAFSMADAPRAERESVPKTENRKPKMGKLPADAVIVLCERAEEGLDLIPKAVILRPDKYQELLDQIEKLKKQIENQKNENAVPPTRCFLKGKVGPNLVRLEAEFAGTAEHADTLVSLACPQAGTSSAQTDGRIAQIRRSNAGGFLVRIDKAGEYHVKLELLVPLTRREGNTQGFELTLPRAVVTELDLDLPANCTDVRLGGQLFKDLSLPGLELKNNHLRGNPGLGPVDKLDLSWREVLPSTGDPVRTVEGRIQARLDAAGLTTEADLWLGVEGVPTKVWRLLVPRNAEVKLIPSDKETRIEHRIETDDQKYASASLRTIHLKEARSEPLHVQIRPPRLPLPQRSSTMPIGPFFVFDAVRQTGTVVVRNQVRHLHLDYRGHGDMQLRRQDTEEPKGEAPATVATLVYSNVPPVEGPTGLSAGKVLPWLELEAVRVPAQVRMRVAHTLTLRTVRTLDSGSSSSPVFQWEIRTTITPATKWADVEQLKIFVPPQWEPVEETISVVPNSNPPYVIIPSVLLREAPTQPQRLEGRYKMRHEAQQRVVLKLPRPQGTIESCEVKLEAPADVEVFLNNAEQLDLELSRQPRPNEQIWRCRSLPTEEVELEVSWRPYRPELRITSVVDLTLDNNRGDVHQELRLQLPPTPPPFLTLRVPAGVGDSLQIQDDQGQDIRSLKFPASAGGRHPPTNGSPSSEFRIPVTAKDGSKEWQLVLRYTTHLVEKKEVRSGGDVTPAQEGRDQRDGRLPGYVGKPFVVPLVKLEQATAGSLKVRIWSEAGFLPRVASPQWEEQHIEEVKNRSFPILVLRATKLDVPLRLILIEQAAGFSALVESARMRVRLEEGGIQSWHVIFQIRQIADRHLDLLLPAPVATLKAQFSFNGRQVTPLIINDKGQNDGGGNIARLRLPRLEDREPTGNVRDHSPADDSPGSPPTSSTLEVSFQSLPGRNGNNLLHTTLQPPQILRATAVPTCWQVSVPPNRVLLMPESAPAVERVWLRRGWLLAASFLVSPELRQDNEPVALVYWQDQSAPLLLTHVPQLGWLMICSLGLLIVGLGLHWTAGTQTNGRSQRTIWFWPLLAAAALTTAVAALFWPTLLCAVVYGCEPGAAVLLMVLGVQWLMHQRYRRQIIFLPSFSRGRTGSSLVRKGSSHRPPSSEPSTVDAPPFEEDKVTG